MKREKPWNRCDVCGRFIAFADFGQIAIREIVREDSDYSIEEYETLCPTHSVGHPALELADDWDWAP